MPISSSAIVRIIRRELDQVLASELQSEHAKAVAALIDEALRHVIARLEIEQDLLTELIDAHATLKGERTGESQADATLVAAAPDRQTRWEQTSALAESIEPELLRRLRTDLERKPKLARITDPFCVRAIAAEHALLRKSAEFERALSHPTHSPEEAAPTEISPQRLGPVLAQLLPERRDLHIVQITPLLGGFSKETVLVDLESSTGAESIALRRDNPFGPVDSTVADEFHLLKALYRAGLAVAEPLALETNCAALSSPFLLTRKMPGKTVPNTLGVTVSAEHVQTILAFGEFLARLHSTDLRTLHLPRAYYKPELSLREVLLQDLDKWETACRAEVERAPLTITSVFEWLRMNVPDAPVNLSLVHGDAGPHNVLMHEGKISCVLDWELAHVGDPAEDLTYFRLWIDQVMPFDEFLQHYYRHGGPEYSQERGQFFAAFIHARNIMTSLRAYVGMAHAPHPQLSALIAMIRYARMFELAAAEDIAVLPR